LAVIQLDLQKSLVFLVIVPNKIIVNFRDKRFTDAILVRLRIEFVSIELKLNFS
jgi:hypothetical protein